MKKLLIISLALFIALSLCFVACEEEPDDSTSSKPEPVPTFEISFDSNGGSAVESQKVKEGKPLTKPADPTRAGYTFEGWYVDGEKWSFVGYVVTREMTLVAKWTPNNNTIVFNANGGTGSMSNQAIATNASANLSANVFTRAGYTFMGWATSASGSVVYQDGASYTMGTNSSYTLYAVWQANTNTLVFNANGGIGSMSNQAIATNASANLNANTFTRKGYTFKGWATSASGSVEYQDGASYTMGTNSSYTLYAVWQANTYTITYNKDGGTESAQNPTTFTINDLPLSLNYLNDKADKIFVGWYTQSDFSGTPVLKITEIGDIELFACYSTDGVGLTFTQSNTGWEITGFTGSLTDVVIPSYYRGKAVTSIGNYAFSSCTLLTSITIPNSVTSIGSSAFYDCDSLTSATIGNSVTSIGGDAFSGCTSLTSITIPDSVKTIGGGAFYECTSLTSVKIGNSVKTIGDDAFYGCTSLGSITIPNSVTWIGFFAFEGCTSLTSLDYLGTIEQWCNISFYYSNPLSNGANLYLNGELVTELVIPDTVTKIKDYAFNGCKSLTSITIPNSVKTIGERAFYGCTSLTIYCEAEAQPSGWNSSWNYSSRPVYWYSESEPTTEGNYWHYGTNGEIIIWE